MNNKVRNGIIFLVIEALYGGFILYDTHKPQTGASPVIKVPKGNFNAGYWNGPGNYKSGYFRGC